MTTRRELKFDEIGYWSEVKLDILKEYAAAYSAILAKQPKLKHIYVDGFAGAGEHISKQTRKLVRGSPLNALNISPPFLEYHFVELAEGKAEHLRSLTQGRTDVSVHEGDCNRVLLDEVLPRARYEDYRRALLLLDPYGLALDWAVIERAGKMKSVDLFLNFPIMDMNRNAFWTNPVGVDPKDVDRMTAFWGDESWRTVVYKGQPTLWGGEDQIKVASNQQVAEAFRERLRIDAGFKEVPKPMPMRNCTGAIVYYLFFASQKQVAAKIARAVLKKYGQRDQ
jgi:three-Cys-motif partner protein